MNDYNKSIAILIHLIVMNNAFGVANALKKEGYDTKNFIPAPELEAALLQLSIADKAKFFRVMKNIEWNPGHVSTNDAEVINNMVKFTQQHASPSVSKVNWWPALVHYFSTQ